MCTESLERSEIGRYFCEYDRNDPNGGLIVSKKGQL
jgi:hypothetical protein